MEITLLNYDNIEKDLGGLYSHATYKINVPGYIFLYVFTHPSNCKVVSYENVQGLLLRNNSENLFKLIDVLNKRFYAVVFKCTFTNKKHVTEMSKHFQLVSCEEIPIGYDKGLQYHLTFKSNSSKKYDYRFKKPKEDLLKIHLKKIMEYKSDYWRNNYINNILENG